MVTYFSTRKEGLNFRVVITYLCVHVHTYIFLVKPRQVKVRNTNNYVVLRMIEQLMAHSILIQTVQNCQQDRMLQSHIYHPSNIIKNHPSLISDKFVSQFIKFF